MDDDLVREVVGFLQRGEDVALITIINTSGSSPRHGGASMVARGDGSTSGTIGGGALEAKAGEAAREVLVDGEPRLLEFHLTADDSAGLGMICGGSGVVLVDRLSASNPASMKTFAALDELLRDRRKGWLATTVTGLQETGWSVERLLLESRQDLHLGVGEHVVEGFRTVVHLQPLGVHGTAYVFGAGHCGEALASVLPVAGFATVVLDDRPDFAQRRRFPAADEVVVLESFERALDGLDLDEESYVVIVTRGHLHDKTVLAQALRTPAGYIGMIGSRKKVAAAFAALRTEGFTEEDVARVHAPIGLSIGAETPGEIAISIVAQMVEIRAQHRPDLE